MHPCFMRDRPDLLPQICAKRQSVQTRLRGNSCYRLSSSTSDISVTNTTELVGSESDNKRPIEPDSFSSEYNQKPTEFSSVLQLPTLGTYSPTIPSLETPTDPTQHKRQKISFLDDKSTSQQLASLAEKCSRLTQLTSDLSRQNTLMMASMNILMQMSHNQNTLLNSICQSQFTPVMTPQTTTSLQTVVFNHAVNLPSSSEADRTSEQAFSPPINSYLV
jgi:hypothetical protein